ncbi:ABC transporter permease subunit [Actinokineospora auranticolor]|uniref:ABC-2 type transport system permease protein n=1 Tax=Actinokineospora auranticolor TaxID=155976 RepID=A0A2S6GY82_9PSEU|nr:ABC transporter permease subunit [Actinokineospora auranticolor]PPK70189.1 ABC-2 type transport system permease protein [Actinokineospora auranticolor]
MTAMTVGAEVGAPVRRAPLLRLFRSELRMILRRPRNIIGIGLLGLVPVVAGIGISIAASGSSSSDGDSVDGLAALVDGNGMLLPIFALVLALNMLLPLTGAMLAADALAGESAHGTLRGLLLAPVGRGRLLAVKAMGVATVVLLSIVLMAVTGLVTGLLLLGGDGMLSSSGTQLPFVDGLGRIGLTIVLLTVQIWALAAVALAVSAYTEHPLIVIVCSLGLLIVSGVLSAIPALDWLDPVLIISSWESIGEVVRDPLDWAPLGEGVLRAVCYMVIGISIAYGRMLSRDG